MILQKRRNRVVVGVPARLTTLSRHSGHGRVWGEVLDRLSRMTDLVVGTDQTADVWLDNGHDPDPEIAGPVVACAYEVSWGTPELDAEFPPETLGKLSAATAQAMARATHIVTGAQTSKKQLMDYYGLAPNRVHVYPFGVDHELFHPRRASEGRALVRERTGDDRPYLIFTSAISPRKNLQAVRGALLRVADRGFPHALVIVASDPPGDFDLEAIRREAFAEIPGHPGRILRIVDPTDEELASLIAGATAACQPSRFEGFGLPALEAMASGVPVVVSNRAAPPEVVGRAGWVVEPTAEGVEQALLEIMENPVRAQRMGAQARQRAQSFTWDRTANGWLHILRRAARQSRWRQAPHC
jgi:alpha-1,3-rhamnosyl/mannosyltransferase